MMSIVIGFSCSIGHATYNSLHVVCLRVVSSGVKMVKIILMFSISLACFYLVTSEKDLPSGLKGWLMNYSIDGRHMPEREESNDAKNVDNAKRVQGSMSGSASTAHYARKLFDLAYRSANPEIAQVYKVSFQMALIYCGLIKKALRLQFH